MNKIILLACMSVVSLTGVCRPTKTVHIRSFKEVVAAVNRAKSFQVSWSNGDETAWTMVSCPDRAATTTFNDVGMRSALVSIGNDVWQSHNGISGPWAKKNNPPPQVLCGKAGLVFPAYLDFETAVRGKLTTTTQGSCEEWHVKTRQKGPLTYVYCIGPDRLPVYSTIEGGMFFNSLTFSEWNKPVKIEPPKDGEPPCCPPMR